MLPALQPSFIDEPLCPSEYNSFDSLPMKPVQPIYGPTRSPPPEPTHPPVRFTPESDEDGRPSRYRTSQPRSGEATLISYLDNGRNPYIAQGAERRLLPPINDLDDIAHRGDRQYDIVQGRPGHINGKDFRSGLRYDGLLKSRTTPSEDGKDSLQNLAAGALQAVNRVDEPPDAARSLSTADISASTRKLSLHDSRDLPPDLPRYRSPSIHSPKPRPPMLNPPTAPLPPLAAPSPGSDHSGQSLPSIRSTLGDIKLSHPDHDLPGRHAAPPPYSSYSPPSGPHHHPSLTSSSPISPPDSYARSLPSPRAVSASSPYSHLPNALQHRPSVDFSGSSTCGEAPSMEQSLSAPGPSGSAADRMDRMSIDGITSQGVYVCNVSGCNAPPFQTQYLLNSHANVHSSARPHYCPVPGCSRSEGGKGFKRKNEMIRHGLVHDSPGYICPFCPDRDHKYPRPDNLQR